MMLTLRVFTAAMLAAFSPGVARAAQMVIACPPDAGEIVAGPWTATLPPNILHSATWKADTREMLCMYAVPAEPRPVFFLFRRSTPPRCVMSFATGTNARIITPPDQSPMCEPLRANEDGKRGECVAVCQTE